MNVGGTANVASLGVPLVYYSTDYVFDGRKREPYVESDGPNPQSAYGRTKLHGEAAAGEHAWIVRSSWLFGPTGHNFVRTMLRLGAERDEVAVVDDQRGSPTYVGHLAAATREVARAPVRRLPRRRGRRVQLGRLRGGDLRGGRLSAAASAGSRPRSSAGQGAAAGLLGAAQREGRAGAAALARGPAGASPPSARPTGRIESVASYSFLTTWILDAPRDDVWEAIYALEQLARRGGGASSSVDKLEHGDGDGVGALYRHEWRSVAPVSRPLRDADHERRAAVPDRGGGRRRARRHRPLALLRRPRDGRHLRVERADDEAVDERARAGRAAVFRWNHNVVMHHGGQGLADLLGARLLAVT